MTRFIRDLGLVGRASHTTIARGDLAESLVFGQQHLGTQHLFQEAFGQAHTIPLSRFPHYEFLARHLDDASPDTSFYARYMQASWAYRFPELNTPERRRERMEEFKAVYRNIESRRHLGADAILTPVSVCRRPDGRLIVVKGNHRASAALKLGIDLKIEHVEAESHLGKIASISGEEEGRRVKRAPRSIFRAGTEIVKGNDRLGLRRMKEIRPEDLAGRHVVELGCGIGTHCFLAAESGATRVTGFDADHRLVSAAVRMNAFMGATAMFRTWEAAAITIEPPAQTVLCFSPAELMARQEQIRRMIGGAGGVLYFEGERGVRPEEYRHRLAAVAIRSIELLPQPESGGVRPLLRCQLD